MTSRASSKNATAFVSWLVTGAVGPALVALPVNWGADKLASEAVAWFKRFRQTDDLSRLAKAASGASVQLSRSEVSNLRALLEREQTWRLLAGGRFGETLGQLTTQIADCLPSQDGRTADDARMAAEAITRGLLEFAVYELEPDIFQKVVLARLQQMTGQTSELDEALLRMHKDLYQRVGEAENLFRQAMDRMPPGSADISEVRIYLQALIDWVNVDPWPQDRRFEGPVLTPAVIERKLQVTAMGTPDKESLDVDGLAKRCGRLIVLGGPGSGKTWLAKRTVRLRAEDAIQALGMGATLDEVELPLYTTCSHLFKAGGSIREAVISSALNELGDLGGARISAALGVHFAERNSPTLLVIDSLDEAHGSDTRLRQADTLPWRIILTSRPSSWNHQLAIDQQNDSHLVGELQSLRYPGDVEPFIHRWFTQQAKQGEDLAAQIALRPDLQQAATVPLILAFYCIVASKQLLPDFRHDLYSKVLNRLLTGQWRGSRSGKPNADACRQALREWAWSASAGHPVSGVGMWADDFHAAHMPLSGVDDDALNHVVTPIGPPDVDTGYTVRRFIHRSIREHLVAEHVARLPVDAAVEALLPHLWYDQDWEYSAPAALAMHPCHDQLMRRLICRAARSTQIPLDLSAIDAGRQIQGLLAQVAAESSEADWSPEIAEMIGQARVALARSGILIAEAPHWGTSNCQAREVLLGMLAGDTCSRISVRGHVSGVVRFAVTEEDKRETRAALLRLLASETDGEVAGPLADGVIRLDASSEDKRKAREALLRLLSSQSNDWATADLADVLTRLDVTSEDKLEVREALLMALAGPPRQRAIGRLADLLAQFATTAEDRRQARKALLRLLVGETNSWVAAGDLAYGLTQLDPTAEDKRKAREVLLKLLANQASSWRSEEVAYMLTQLDPVPEDRRQARDALLRLLADEAEGYRAVVLASLIVQLATTTEEKRQAREALFGLLLDEPDSWATAKLAYAVAALDPTAEDKRQAREALLGVLADEADSRVAELAGGMTRLDFSGEDKREVREALLRILPGQTSADSARNIGEALDRLDSTAEDKRRVRETLLRWLSVQRYHQADTNLAHWMAVLDLTAEEKRQARETLFRVLADENRDVHAWRFAQELEELDPTVCDLVNCCNAVVSPSGQLLARARRNSTLADWLDALPSLTSLSGDDN